jgi:hypothetical protein
MIKSPATSQLTEVIKLMQNSLTPEYTCVSHVNTMKINDQQKSNIKGKYRTF